MRVIDGMHRLRAAEIRGDVDIAVCYFDGNEIEAFVHAVRANVVHGMPLSRADREAAVIRLIRSHPHWSDRAIAEVVGLSAPTVGVVRRRTTVNTVQVVARVGRDGRMRPLNSAEGRRKASEVIRRRPDASLRDVAREAGISVGTVRDVRERLRRGESPVPYKIANEVGRHESAVGARQQFAVGPWTHADAVSVLQNLRRDPSVRFTESGRALLQWFGVHAIGAGEHENFLRSIPEHCRGNVAELARGCAEIWQQLAVDLEQLRFNTA
jgi:hypothetical protein